MPLVHCWLVMVMAAASVAAVMTNNDGGLDAGRTGGVDSSDDVVEVPAQIEAWQKALKLSLDFFLAQRSGKLPPEDKVSWTRDAFLDDGRDLGVDLSGGFHDGAGYVKFGLPMAYSMTMLSWGLIRYPDAYSNRTDFQKALNIVRWGTDYLMKTHISAFELVSQVGNETEEISYWGRPEDYPNTPRKCYKLDRENPGSDVVGETAAALAAASILFRPIDAKYSALLLQHAEQLHVFADQFRGFYTDSNPDAKQFYPSWSYADELVWSALWLHKATEDVKYLNEVLFKWDEFHFSWQDTLLNWEDKRGGIVLLMYELISGTNFRNKITHFVMQYKSNTTTTPGGLLFWGPGGTCSHAATAAFQLLVADDLGLGLGIAHDLAKTQINYILGENPLKTSYIIGFGNKYPTYPHHMASSCLPKYACNGCDCSWEAYHSPNPNPNVLRGALVGGPDQNDHWEDKRSDAIRNGVGLDYNAGFQSAVAGLIIKEQRKMRAGRK